MGSATRAPLEFMLYHMALMMSGLWCFGLLCFGRIVLGMMVGCFIFALSFWSPSCVASMNCNVWSSCVVIVSMCVCVLKYFTGLFPRSMLMIGHLPLLCVWRRPCGSLNVMECLKVLSFALYLHPPKRCVLVSAWLVTLLAEHRPCDMFSFAAVDVCSPGYLIRVPPASILRL